MSKSIKEDLREGRDSATSVQDDTTCHSGRSEAESQNPLDTDEGGDSQPTQDDTDVMVCGICDVPMEPMKSTFSYLKREFRHTVLRCPICGQIYISEDLAKGKMREVETILEEK